MAANGGSVTSSMSSLMYGTMALNIVMAASFQLLWSMLNVVQLIINMPLMNVNFPSNAILFYNLLMTMAQFNILPSNSINQQVFNIDTATMQADNIPNNF